MVLRCMIWLVTMKSTTWLTGKTTEMAMMPTGVGIPVWKAKRKMRVFWIIEIYA